MGDGTDEQTRMYLVRGQVQGVGYRYFAMRAAQRLGIRGTVKNLRDGRVEVRAAGPAKAMAAFRVELQSGPEGSAVSGVDEKPLVPDHDFGDEFKVEYER
ncbi:MAG: acylphosphatase [Candidatus Acidiferrales bacterium]